MILLYAIVHNIKFDVGYVIERGIIEPTQGRCTGALIHSSLITLLCKLAEVPMLESEEKYPHKLPVPLPTKKNGSSQDMDEKTYEEGGEEGAVTTAVEEDPQEEKKEVEIPMGPMDPQLKKLNVGLASATWKEFTDYKKSNYNWHLDNARLTVH